MLGALPPNAKVGSLELTASSNGGGGVEQVDGKVPPINNILQLVFQNNRLGNYFVCVLAIP